MFVHMHRNMPVCINCVFVVGTREREKERGISKQCVHKITEAIRWKHSDSYSCVLFPGKRLWPKIQPKELRVKCFLGDHIILVRPYCGMKCCTMLCVCSWFTVHIISMNAFCILRNSTFVSHESSVLGGLDID